MRTSKISGNFRQLTLGLKSPLLVVGRIPWSRRKGLRFRGASARIPDREIDQWDVPNILPPYPKPIREETMKVRLVDTLLTYLRKSHQIMDTKVVITKAPETTIKLNLRIRLSYACAQLSCWSLSNVRFAVPTNPLAFTYPFF